MAKEVLAAGDFSWNVHSCVVLSPKKSVEYYRDISFLLGGIKIYVLNKDSHTDPLYETFPTMTELFKDERETVDLIIADGVITSEKNLTIILDKIKTHCRKYAILRGSPESSSKRTEHEASARKQAGLSVEIVKRALATYNYSVTDIDMDAWVTHIYPDSNWRLRVVM